MKVAARFPIKPSPILFWGLVAVHACLMILPWLIISHKGVLCLLFVSTLISAYFSFKHYRRITQAPDDLCWSGDNWLISQNEKLKTTVYLNLQAQSWRSSFACLLHFSAGQQTYVWLFTRAGLGDRAFRELCYLSKQNLAAQLKQHK